MTFYKERVSNERSDLIVGSHLNIAGVITANYDELSRLERGGSHAAKLVDLARTVYLR